METIIANLQKVTGQSFEQINKAIQCFQKYIKEVSEFTETQNTNDIQNENAVFIAKKD